ncbi:MAG: ATP-dependent sacrificial sulfur transferase LarE [Deltaproteobacteria bacterium]|nr:ATP-dependent sacrificial sulfur transferase LarE [Deltaproteobacteria bacterium]
MGLETKFKDLKETIGNFPRVVVAYSGGVDSTLLLKVCVDVLGGENVLALIGISPTYPKTEIEEAKKLADLIGAPARTIDTHEMENPDFVENSRNRCYYCKLHLFRIACELAGREGYTHVLEGSNIDDEKDYRPGRRAIAEFKVKSPLFYVGLNKKEIRTLSKMLGLPTHNKPSYACLSSRIPYGTAITFELLNRIELSEMFMKRLGLTQVRVRCHNDIARLEVEPQKLPEVLKHREEIIRELKQFGFNYITLDLQGYRSGSMNEPLEILGHLDSDEKTA